jgi:hypothetical protein
MTGLEPVTHATRLPLAVPASLKNTGVAGADWGCGGGSSPAMTGIKRFHPNAIALVGGARALVGSEPGC